MGARAYRNTPGLELKRLELKRLELKRLAPRSMLPRMANEQDEQPGEPQGEPRERTRVVAVGDVMVELARGNDGRFGIGCGGDAFNTAIYLARAGTEVAFATALGDDTYSDGILALAAAENVRRDLILRVRGRTPGLCLVDNDASGARRQHHWGDGAPARDLFELSEWPHIAGGLVGARLVYFTGITLSLYSNVGLGRFLAAVEMARKAGARIAFDGNFRPRGWKGDVGRARTVFLEALKRVDLALPTFDDEAILWGDPSPEATVERLQASEAQNRRFVSDVSHELRTPLTALVAEASVIEAGLDGLAPDARRAAELLVADVRRLRILVEDLMELSRFDARAEQADLRPTDLGEATRSIVSARLPGAAVHGPPAQVVVAADVRRLDRIIGNLLDNAGEHAPGTPVEVRVGDDGANAIVTVGDRGPGVPEDVLEHLFERFYKADASRHGGSSGLGLAIAAEHAALLGGSLSARNRDGGGLEVTLRLPRVVSESLLAGDVLDTARDDAGGGSDAGSAPTEQARPNP